MRLLFRATRQVSEPLWFVISIVFIVACYGDLNGEGFTSDVEVGDLVVGTYHEHKCVTFFASVETYTVESQPYIFYCMLS